MYIGFIKKPSLRNKTFTFKKVIETANTGLSLYIVLRLPGQFFNEFNY